jgi:hypothetical protein
MYVSSMSLLQPRSGVFLDVVGLFQNSCVCMEAHSIHTWVHPYYRPTDFLPQTFVTTRLPDYLGGEREREREKGSRETKTKNAWHELRPNCA